MSTFAANYVLSFFSIGISSSEKLKHEVRAHVTNVNRKYPVFLEYREIRACVYMKLGVLFGAEVLGYSSV